MRLATFNLFSGRSPADGRVESARVRAAIASLDADVLALQEVDRDQPRSHCLDLTALAARALGAPHRVFAPALYGTPGGRWHRAGGQPRPGPAYGCALVSRFPLRHVEVLRMSAAPVAVPLPVPGHGIVLAREEPRVALVATVDAPAGAFTVVATHLAFTPGWNRRQLRRVVAAVADRPDPVLLCGDLNLAGDTPARLTGWTPLVAGPTYPSTRARRRLDHVLLRGDPVALGGVVGTEIRALPVSDHRAVLVDLGR